MGLGPPILALYTQLKQLGVLRSKRLLSLAAYAASGIESKAERFSLLESTVRAREGQDARSRR